MAAGSWKDWAQGELVTESGFQDIQDSVVFIYASEAAANAALTNKVEGTIFYDTTADVLKAWDGSAWISAETGDISSVIAGTNLNGGGTSGDVTLNLDSTLTGISDVQDSGNTSLVGRKNYIINGNFDIWQRGTSLTGETGNVYLADRWLVSPNGATYNYEQGSFTVGQTDVPNNPKYFLNITVTGADNNLNIRQTIEDVRTFSSETITISFWAKYTTNAPTNFVVRARQYFGSGGSTQVDTDFAGQTLTTSWQKFTLTGTLPSISGKSLGSGHHIAIFPFLNTNNETFDVQIAQVQVEKGSVATDFEYRPIGEELSLCRRYFHRFRASSGNFQTPQIGYCTGAGSGMGIADIYYDSEPFINFRAAPTASFTGTNSSGNWRIFRLYDNSTNDTQSLQSISVSYTAIDDAGGNGFRLRLGYNWGTGASAGNFTNQAHYRINSISGSPYIVVNLDCEL